MSVLCKYLWYGMVLFCVGVLGVGCFLFYILKSVLMPDDEDDEDEAT